MQKCVLFLLRGGEADLRGRPLVRAISREIILLSNESLHMVRAPSSTLNPFLFTRFFMFYIIFHLLLLAIKLHLQLPVQLALSKVLIKMALLFYDQSY